MKFFRTGRLGVVEDILVAKDRTRPAILVAPFGSTGAFTDEEWANGARPHEGVGVLPGTRRRPGDRLALPHDPRRLGRALVGLSEGGYGALNIGLHHPGEFHVLESWSGYVVADDIASIFEHRKALLDWNSPVLTLPAAAPALRAAHT